MNARFRQRGYTLITALMVMMLMTLMGISQMESHRLNMITAGREKDYMDSYLCTESALNLGFDWLRNRGRKVLNTGSGLRETDPVDVTDPSAIPDPVALDPITDPRLGGYCAPRNTGCQLPRNSTVCSCSDFGTTIVVDPADRQDRTGQSYELRATSHTVLRPEDAMTMVYRFTIENFSKFAWFSEEDHYISDTSLSWDPVDSLNGGRAHTNDQENGFLVAGATFWGPVSQTCLGLPCTECACRSGTFNGGFKAGVTVPLPSRDDFMNILDIARSDASDMNLMTRADVNLWANTATALPQGGAKQTSEFWGNTWIRFNDPSDLWWTPINLTFDKLWFLRIRLNGAGAPSDLAYAYNYQPGPTLVQWGQPSTSGNWEGWILDVGMSMNFIENSLIGNLVRVSWGAGTSATYVIVGNDRNNLVIADTTGANPIPPQTGITIQIAAPMMTIWNADYNRSTKIPTGGQWGVDGADLTIADFVQKIAFAVNGNFSGPGITTPAAVPVSLQPLASFGYFELTSQTDNVDNFDLVFGNTIQDSDSPVVVARVDAIPGLTVDDAFGYLSLGGNYGDPRFAEGQGPAAGIGWNGTPPSGLISVLDPCNPIVPEYDFTNCKEDDREATAGLIVSSSDWGESSSDVRLWGVLGGALSIGTMRDIYLITNRASLPIWDSAIDVLLPEHDYDTIHFAKSLNATSLNSFSIMYGPGFLPVNDGGDGGMGDATCWAGAAQCAGINDQSQNLYGLIYKDNPNKDDVAFESYGGHYSTPDKQAPCVNAGYTINDGCVATAATLPFHDYAGGCSGEILGLFAYQDILVEDPSPRSSGIPATNGFLHQPAWDVYIQGVLMALNPGIVGEHVLQNYPTLYTWRNLVTTNTYPPSGGNRKIIDVKDRGDHTQVDGSKSGIVGPLGHLRIYGGMIQKFPGRVGTATAGYKLDLKYDTCIPSTGAPPYTPEIPSDNPIVSFRYLPTPCTMMNNSL